MLCYMKLFKCFQSGDEGSLSVPRTRTNTQILNLQDPGAEDMTEPEGPESVSQSKPSAVVSHDYNQHSSSATGDIRIHEVKPDGKSICLVNMSNDKDIDFSGYALKQQVGGCPVALYRFPPKTMFAAKSYITVYSGCNDVILHQPPTQFVWREQDRWGTGPECTTILCKPNGQAVAWMTAAHRFGDISMETKNVDGLSSDLPTFTRNLNAPQQEMLLLKRQKESPPSLAPPKQPHGNAYCQVHSSYNEKRVKDLGNDNSSNHRQARCQAMAVPDKVPGEPYAGIKGQTMGSSTMRRYTPLNPRSGNVRMNGSITNRVQLNGSERTYKNMDGNIRFGSVSPFNSPQQQEFSRALENKSTLLTTSVQFV
ncbi:LMNTD1 [Bugula neritina]|uniref:LMNTD1 n=1 Tax=Bugula neritina TaxID=10212 RepID=A0A7J7J222_BUGNE|nr:LMNTD1 [Bugula neritina]